jgi:uncharacterized repeat protein (TIGR01451 family)
MPRETATEQTPVASSEPATTGARSSEQALADAAIPSIRVETVGPAAVTLGDEADYCVSFVNQSEVDAQGLTATVSVPGNVSVLAADSPDGSVNVDNSSVGGARVVLSLDRLPGRSKASLDLRLQPQANQPFELATNWSLQPPASSARIDVLQALLKLSISGASELVYGDTDRYTIELENPGTGDATNVSIQVVMGEDTSGKLVVGTVPAGLKKSFDVDVTAQQAGVLEIVASAAGDRDLQTQAIHKVNVKRADLKLQAIGPGLQYAGATGAYAVRVSNLGNATAESVQAQVQLPAGVQYAQGLENARQEGDTLIWQVGDLAAGTYEDYRFQCDLAADGEKVFRFDVKALDGLKADASVATQVEAIADLKLTVKDPKGPIPVGQEVTYEIQIINRGTEAATEVNVVGQFSEGIEPTATGGMRAEIAEGQAVFAPISRIAPEETVQLTVTARATTGGNHVFRASVQCSDPETRLVAEDTTRYYGENVSSTLDTPASSPSDEPPAAPTQASQWEGGGWR